MARYKLILAYDGRPFSGWQSQRRGNTVQDIIESAMASLCRRSVRVHSAGRTDAGVHALAQVAHFDAPDDCRFRADEWGRALNALLPATIRILNCEVAPGDFHARFDAAGKIYRYRLWHADVLPPLENGLAWHLHDDLDHALVRHTARLFEGTHDFTAFSANRAGTAGPPSDKIRTIHQLSMAETGELIELTFDGDGFLFKMVRMITGAIIHVARGRAPIERIVDLLANPHQKKPGWQAPPDGLFLVAVRY